MYISLAHYPKGPFKGHQSKWNVVDDVFKSPFFPLVPVALGNQ